MPRCLEWAEQRTRECNQREDRGYNECTGRREERTRNCCDWWPCRMFCRVWSWIVNIVCVAWTWISNVVCVGWTWLTSIICVVWDVITTIVNAIIVTIESTFGWILSAFAFVIELLKMIPVIGALIRWLINAITYIYWAIVSIPDFVLGVLGVRPEKKLRICTIILRDQNGIETATSGDVINVIQLAARVLKRDCNIKLMPSRPYQYGTGFNLEKAVNTDWVIIDRATSDNDLLDPMDSFGHDWLGVGSRFQQKLSTLCFYGGWRRVIGYGAPITIFITRDAPDVFGFSPSITDYVFVDANSLNPSPRTLLHEVGHKCFLTHRCVDDNNRNLMALQGNCNPRSNTPVDRQNPEMDTLQALLVRASKHVTYF